MAYPEPSPLWLSLPKTYGGGTRILTGFPFGIVQLGDALGPANSRLTTSAEKTSPLRRHGFSPCCSITTARIFIHCRSIGAYAPTSTQQRHPPTGSPSLIRRCPGVSVAGLSPVHFRRLKPRRVSCYALFKGWLLLSLPPRCLRFETTFSTLSPHLGTLTPVWAVSLLRDRLTPSHAGSLHLRSWRLRSLTRDRALSSPKPPISNSTPPASSAGTILGDISEGTCYRRVRLAFHPYSRVTRTLLQNRLRASMFLSEHFTLPRSRSPGFRSCRSDYPAG